jgi:hypothetical protein
MFFRITVPKSFLVVVVVVAVANSLFQVRIDRRRRSKNVNQLSFGLQWHGQQTGVVLYTGNNISDCVLYGHTMWRRTTRKNSVPCVGEPHERTNVR